MAKAQAENKDGFKVGDILICTWGWDQTNVDYYIVTRVSRSSVWYRQLPTLISETGFMCGQAVPGSLDKAGEEEYCRRSRSYTYNGKTEGVVNDSWGHHSAWKWDGKSHYVSWYA